MKSISRLFLKQEVNDIDVESKHCWQLFLFLSSMAFYQSLNVTETFGDVSFLMLCFPLFVTITHNTENALVYII